MYSAYKLHKQGDSIQPWSTPFSIWNQFIVPCPVLTVASWPSYTFLRRQIRWSGIPISWRIFHSLLWSTLSKTLVNEAEVVVFLEFSCFLYDPTDVGNLISGSSAFSKVWLCTWKFSVHIALNPSFKEFDHNLTSIWNKCKWTFFGIALLWDWKENWPFPLLWPLLSFLNSACTSGSSWVTYGWSLAWGILSIALLTCEMSEIVW